MTMKNVDKLEYFKQLLSKGMFPNEHNRVWTMCQTTLQMLVMTVIEAERAGLTDKSFYLAFENAVNSLSVKDHNNPDVSNFEKSLNEFMAD